VGVDRLGAGGGAEQLGDLLEAVGFGFLGEGEVLAVGLGFSGKGGSCSSSTWFPPSGDFGLPTPRCASSGAKPPAP